MSYLKQSCSLQVRYLAANTSFHVIGLGQIALNPADMTVWPSLDKLRNDFYSGPGFSEKIIEVFSDFSPLLGSELSAQLALCARNVHRILMSLNSSLEMILSCIVYLNFSSPSARPRDRESIVNFLNKIFKAIFYREDDDDCVDNNECKPYAVSAVGIIPMTLIYVSDLPRKALAEIEVIAKTYTFNSEFPSLIYIDDRVDDENEDFNEIMKQISGRSAFELFSPLLSHGIINQSNNLDAFHCILSAIGHEGCLLAGNCRLETSNLVDRNASIDCLSAVTKMFLCIKHSLAQSRLLFHYLVSLRIFYNDEMFERSALSYAAGISSVVVFSGVLVPVLLIPIPRFISDEVLCCAFCALSADQLLSDLWILGN